MEAIVVLIILSGLGILSVAYLEGHFSIKSSEDISACKQDGKTTITQKITYWSGRIKYVTRTIKH